MCVQVNFDGEIVEDNKTYKCKWCGKLFIKTHNRQVYCSEECRKHADVYMNNIRVRRYRSRYHLSKDKYYGLGSGYLSGTPDKDFNKEYCKIKNEKRRIGL